MTQTVAGNKGTRRPSGAVATELLDAALVEFSTHGFEAASTRSIAQRAGWHQPQINYHFGSKQEIWQVAVDHLFAELTGQLGDLSGIDDAPVEVFRRSLGHFVAFSARRPELHRIMSIEATVDGPRLGWIVDRHARPLAEQVGRAWTLVRAAGAGAQLSPTEVWQLVIGLGARPFASSPEVVRVTGTAPEVAAQLDLLHRLLGL